MARTICRNKQGKPVSCARQIAGFKASGLSAAKARAASKALATKSRRKSASKSKSSSSSSKCAILRQPQKGGTAWRVQNEKGKSIGRVIPTTAGWKPVDKKGKKIGVRPSRTAVLAAQRVAAKAGRSYRKGGKSAACRR